MKKDDVNKRHTRTWTRINNDSKSPKWRRVFTEQFGGEFVKRIKVWEWKEDIPTPEPEIEVIKPTIKAAYKPERGATPATNAKAIASGTKANATVKPAKISTLNKEKDAPSFGI